jgi:hypothetical protein
VPGKQACDGIAQDALENCYDDYVKRCDPKSVRTTGFSEATTMSEATLDAEAKEFRVFVEGALCGFRARDRCPLHGTETALESLVLMVRGLMYSSKWPEAYVGFVEGFLSRAQTGQSAEGGEKEPGTTD